MISFNGKKLSKIIDYSVDRKTRKTSTEYNANGDMLIDMISRKYTLSLILGPLTEAELWEIYSITEAIFFTVKFTCPHMGELTREFHLGKEPSTILAFSEKGIRYKNVKLVLEEK